MSRGTGPSKRVVAEFWLLGNPSNPDAGLHCDMGEPCCWACEAYITDHDGDLAAYNKAAWLERCHLVAHAAGGDFSPENVVLLCHACHKNMDRELGANIKRQVALAWVRNYRRDYLAAVSTNLERLGVSGPPEDWQKFSVAFGDKLGTADTRSPIAVAHAAAAAMEGS